MTHVAGIRLGPYEILAPLGAGGMGKLYRARDTRLHRDVAVKVLPARTAEDSDALARFDREAKRTPGSPATARSSSSREAGESATS